MPVNKNKEFRKLYSLRTAADVFPVVASFPRGRSHDRKWVCCSQAKSYTEHSDVESFGSRAHICETELGSDEDEEDMYHWDPEGPHIDELIAEEGWLTKWELEENERSNQELQNRFDRIRLNPRRFRLISHLGIISLKNLIIRCRRLRVVPIVDIHCRARWFLRALAFRSLYYPWGKMGTTRSLTLPIKERMKGGFF